MYELNRINFCFFELHHHTYFIHLQTDLFPFPLNRANRIKTVAKIQFNNVFRIFLLLAQCTLVLYFLYSSIWHGINLNFYFHFTINNPVHNESICLFFLISFLCVFLRWQLLLLFFLIQYVILQNSLFISTVRMN